MKFPNSVQGTTLEGSNKIQFSISVAIFIHIFPFWMCPQTYRITSPTMWRFIFPVIQCTISTFDIILFIEIALLFHQNFYTSSNHFDVLGL